MVRHPVKTFFFNYAQYEVGDAAGNKILLKVHYAENKYEIVVPSSLISPAFRHDVEEIAANLLGRKHGVNFVGHVYKAGKQ